MDYVVDALNGLFRGKHTVKNGLKVIYEREKLRYYTVQLSMQEQDKLQ
jgi:tryptophanase